MIDFYSWHPYLRIAFLLAPFVIGLSGVAIGTYIACSRHFNRMLAALPNSVWPRQQDIIGTTSLSSRCYLVSTISGGLLFPQFCIRKGGFDADDIRNFPPDLRRLMLLSGWLVYIGMAWLFLAFALFKLTEG